MATPTLREPVLHTATSGTPATVTTGAGTQIGDVLLTFHGSDYYTAADMTTPTGTAGTWTQRALGDLGSLNSHVKAWTRKVTASGAQTVTVSPNDEECWNTTYVIAGADADDPVDAAAGFNSSATSTSHTAPSISPATSDALLVCCWLTELFRLVNYSTISSPLTKQNEDDNLSTLATGSGALSASGATGTKTLTSDTNSHWVSISIAIKAPSAAANPPRGLIVPRLAVARAAGW